MLFSLHLYISRGDYVCWMHENDEYIDEPQIFGKVAALFCGGMLFVAVVAAICLTL